MDNQTNAPRRKFLQQLGMLAGGSTLLATQSKLQLIKSALAAQDYSNLPGHKSLVCIFLAGGNDGFNMFLPHESNAYNHYQDIRQALAINQGQVLPANNSDYGFHPSMLETRNLYNQNKLAVLSNVGTLYQPLNKTQVEDYRAGDTSILVPPSLFSHSHQQEIWQTNHSPQIGSTPPGWGGVLSDLLSSANQAANLPASISLSGTNPWQSGNQTQPLSVSARGLDNFEYLSETSWPPHQSTRTQVWNDVLQLQRQHLLEQQSANGFITTQSRIAELNSALDNIAPIMTVYPEQNNLANDLRMVAQLISAREELGLKRQFFFIRVGGGWDTHGNQITSHANLLAGLNDALDVFYQTTEELGKENSVTTFTASDFGRSSTSNGDGTDHGWGGHQLVMGGAVNGGQLHGVLPDITPGGIDDSGDAGRLIPTISVDQYGATLAKWMGVADSDLNTIFPNLNQFGVRDLGFMS